MVDAEKQALGGLPAGVSVVRWDADHFRGASVGFANVGSADTFFAGIPFRSAREARGWCGGYLGSRGRSGGADSAAHNDRMLEPQVVAATVRWFPADPVAGAVPDHDVVTPGAGSQICRP